MRRGVSIAGLLFAWLCAQGALTDAMQVFAWGRMFTGYARTMTWSAAVRQTFDPNKPCELCCAVREVRKAERKAPAAPLTDDAAKLVLFLTAAEAGVGPALSSAEFSSRESMATEWCVPVPKPPPRVGRA